MVAVHAAESMGAGVATCLPAAAGIAGPRKAYSGLRSGVVLAVTFEFDRWVTGTGDATWERLDMLALDRTARLVLAELKRGRRT